MSITLNTQGLHPSTLLSLEAISWLEDKITPTKILDMGCGHGVLSLTAAHLWPADILAVDIAPKAIADTQGQIDAYGMQQRITALRSDRFAAPQIAKSGPYDLIMANMLDQWLIEMVSDIKTNLKPAGYAILSGMLAWLTPQTFSAYTGQEFKIAKEFNQLEWRAAVIMSAL